MSRNESKEILKSHFKLTDGMTSEEMTALFFNNEALIESPETIYRLNTSGDRFYYKFNEENEPVFFVSVTTLIKHTTPTSPHLIKWIADMGYEKSKKYASERASYGTFMHKEIAWLLVNKSYNLDDIKPRLKQYIEEENLKGDCIYWEDELKKDILAFSQFMIDHNVKPLAIEIVLSHPTDGYAGAMDLVCSMEWKKNNIIALIDFKSGRKGFFEDAEIQLEAYKTMWNIHFPSKPINNIMNWSPKNWRAKVPTYNLKDQTNSKNLNKLSSLVKISKIEDQKREKNFVVTSGIIDIEKGISENINIMTISEIIKNAQINKDLLT